MLDIEFLVNFFSFNTLNTLSYCFLDFKVPAEKQVDNHIENPLYVMSQFSLAAFKIFSLALFSLITMQLRIGQLEYILLGVHSSYRFVDTCISSNL